MPSPMMPSPTPTYLRPRPRRCVYELAYFCSKHSQDLDHRLLLLSLHWPSTLSPFKSKGLSDDEEGWLRNFRCATAQCYKPSDRAMLLAKIRDEWGSEEAFDAFVRNELPALLETGKGRYFGQPWRVLGNAFDALFGFS